VFLFTHRAEPKPRPDNGGSAHEQMPFGLSEGHVHKAVRGVGFDVLGLARQIITPRGRGNIGFDQPVPVSDDVSVLDRLIAFTGRQPVS
jgi:hypothetical protein